MSRPGEQSALSDSCCDRAVEQAACCDETASSSIDWLLWLVGGGVGGLYLVGLVLPHGDGGSYQFATLAHGVQELFNRMWWGIAIGVVFVGLLARIPRNLVMSVLGHRQGFVSLLRATLAGVFLDLCSHGILAVGMKLYERGASSGQVMAFLLASPWNSFSLTLILFGLIGVGWTLLFIALSLLISPWNSFSLTLILFGLIGVGWTLLFIALSLLIGLLTGWIFDVAVQRGTLPANPHRDLLDAEARALNSLTCVAEFRLVAAGKRLAAAPTRLWLLRIRPNFARGWVFLIFSAPGWGACWQTVSAGFQDDSDSLEPVWHSAGLDDTGTDAGGKLRRLVRRHRRRALAYAAGGNRDRSLFRGHYAGCRRFDEPGWGAGQCLYVFNGGGGD